MDLRWVVDNSTGKFVVGIKDIEIGGVAQVCECMFEFDAEMIRLALEALVDPKEYYRSMSLDPKDIIKGFILLNGKGGRFEHARIIG